MRMIMAIMAVVVYTAMAGNDHAALTGNGTSGGLTITPSGFELSSSTYTVEAWIRISTRNQNHPIMDQFVGNGTTGDWSFSLINYARPSLLMRGLKCSETTETWLSASSQLPLNSWQHVAVAVDGSTVKFYLNGVLDKTYTITSGGSIVPIASGTFRIGSANRENNLCCKGNIVDCRVWSVVRTAKEIAENRCVRLTGNEQGLAAYWPLDEGTGTSVAEKVSGTSSAITGSGYSWEDISTPFIACDVSPRHVLANSNGTWSAGRATTGDFKIIGSAFSLEGWIRPRSLAKFNMLFEQFSLSQAVGDIRFEVLANSYGDNKCIPAFFYRGFGAANWLYGTSEIPLYKWTHLAVTCDGDCLRLYVDGVQEATAERTAASRIIPQQNTPLVLLGYTKDSDANYNPWDGNAINGWASDMRVWNRALSSAEVASNRFVRLTGHETGLVGYWPLAETGGTVATNYAPTALMLNDGVVPDNFAFETSDNTPFVVQSGGMDDTCVLDGGRFDTQMRIWHPSYTVEAWVRLYAYGNNIVCSQFDGHEGDLRMTVNESGKLSGFLRGFSSANWVYSTATVPLRTWTHLALSYDGTKMRLYINGQKDSEFTGNMKSPNGFVNLYVGGTADGTLGFDGRLSDLRVWNTVRTDAEIAAHYASRLTGEEPYLQGYWPLGQSTGSTALNYSRQSIANGVAAETLKWISGPTTPFHARSLTISFR